jgi:hypothetical protein
MKIQAVIMSVALLACCGAARAQVDLSRLGQGMTGPHTAGGRGRRLRCGDPEGVAFEQGAHPANA